MSEETATLMLWMFGIIVFFIAIYSVVQAGNEMDTSSRGATKLPIENDTKPLLGLHLGERR